MAIRFLRGVETFKFGTVKIYEDMYGYDFDFTVNEYKTECIDGNVADSMYDFMEEYSDKNMGDSHQRPRLFGDCGRVSR